MRCVFLLIIALSVSLTAGSVAEASEQLVMPFDCSVEQGRLKISPATEKSYPIIGPRDEQMLTSCTFSPSKGCQSLMAHSFDISCGGVRVSWMQVVGAIGKSAAVRSWINEERLNVELLGGNNRGAKQTCFAPPSGLGAGGGHGWRGVVVSNTCLPRRSEAGFEHMIFPVDYAPVSELGARFVSATAADNAGKPDEASPRPVAADLVETVVAKAYPDPSWKPLSEPVTREAGLVPAVLAWSEWVTVVRSGDDPMVTFADGGSLDFDRLVWLIVAMAAATTTVIVCARKSTAWASRLDTFSPTFAPLMRRLGLVDHGAGRFDGAGAPLTAAGRAVAAILGQAKAAVAQLKKAGPLREVLLSELALVNQRLEKVDAAAAEGHETGEKCAAQFRFLVRDLERIHRIADSAAASFSCGREVAILPKTASEAYSVLGVNPDVSESVLKKVTDALRMSWHPDHAHDEADQRLREDRIRQINIACDLISRNRDLV